MFPFLRRRRVARAEPFSFTADIERTTMRVVEARNRADALRRIEEENRLLERALEAKRKRVELLRQLQES